MTLSAWVKDYSWAGRDGWSEWSDVCLQARIRGRNMATIDAAVTAWLAAQHRCKFVLDGVSIDGAYAGGARFYLAPGRGADQDELSLFIHSHGEDAFDTIAHYAAEITRHLRRQTPEAAIDWVEMPHDRLNHQLAWEDA